ncbi:hypothetical protein D3C81_2093030 [compost metagenome]
MIANSSFALAGPRDIGVNQRIELDHRLCGTRADFDRHALLVQRDVERLGQQRIIEPLLRIVNC